MDESSFYDDIAEYYDLIYADWERSMLHHGAVISEILGLGASGTRILDVSAGIGTQALPLAALGYETVARDSSPGAIRRLRREADERGLDIDAEPSDMRDVSRTVNERFDAVICFDNAIPHLLTDVDILSALRELAGLLRPGGVLLISVRDYEDTDRSPRSVHRYGERVRQGRRYRMSQEWEWYDASHYRTTMIVEEEQRGGWQQIVRTSAAYYAVPVPRLLELIEAAGLEARRVLEPEFFQPVLYGALG